jgi:quercetin dioxygenase-like cupin family protein
MKATRIMLAAVLIIGSSLALHVTEAQQPGITRTDALRHDLGVPGREVIQVRVDFAPGVAFGKHSHPGAEIAYVLEGTLEYELESKPPVTLQAGEALFIPAGTIHAAKNVGTGKAAELATYIVEKGKPLVVMVK